MTVEVGDKLVHPVHGMGVVAQIRPAMDERGDRVAGVEIILRFDRYIEGVKWVYEDPHTKEEKSQLIFNSKYLDRFKQL